MITGYTGADGVVTIPDRVANETGVLVDVADIAPDAFNGCAVTAYAVSAANRYFMADEHGVLCSKDGTRLIRYPSASEETGYEVPAVVTRIESYAFADADKLETVYIPTSAMLNMGEQVFSGCSDRLALYGGAAANPFAVDIPEAIMPDKQGGAEDGEDGDDSNDDNNAGDGYPGERGADRR